MSQKGDTRRQAILRDRALKKRLGDGDEYTSRILSVLRSGMVLCDIGCGTAHIIRDLANHCSDAVLIGLDVSPGMLAIAATNTRGLHNVNLVAGDGMGLPLADSVVDIVVSRLAEYSHTEAYRSLRKGGYLFEYGLGPEANKEIAEFFPDRIERGSFFFPKNPETWKEEISEGLPDAGFTVTGIDDFREKEHYETVDELMDLMEMVPLVGDLDRERDRGRVEELAETYGTEKGVDITWHYTIVEARRPPE